MVFRLQLVNFLKPLQLLQFQCSLFTDMCLKRSRIILKHLDTFWFKQGGRWDSLRFLGGFSAPTLPSLGRKPQTSFTLFGVMVANDSQWLRKRCLDITAWIQQSCWWSVDAQMEVLHFGFGSIEQVAALSVDTLDASPQSPRVEKVAVQIQQKPLFSSVHMWWCLSGHVFWTDSVMGQRSTPNR